MSIHSRQREIRQRNASVPDALQRMDINPLLKRIYANRNIEAQEQVSYALEHLLGFDGLKGIDAAARIVVDAIEAQRKILIVGDYDADGATSTAVVIRALHGFGFDNVDFLVPNRFEYGYGLTPQIVELAATRQPDVLITVDNGISSIDGVSAAKQHHMQVVITDHHLPGRELPQADAIVNPNQPGCDFASKSIAGVGVAFYLMLAVRAELRERNWFADRREPNMAALLDLVALGTVADVVPLDRNNRILVEFGLRRIRGGQSCAGIRALFDVAGKDIAQCSSSDLGFFIAPRLNAAGRLDDMSAGIECLISDSTQTASSIAAQLNELNQQRKQIEQGMLHQALDSFEHIMKQFDDGAGEQDIEAGLCLFDAQWHQGVIGLLAARIKERFHRPVIAFADAGDGELKGSARSIPGLHIRDTLDAIAAKHPGLITKFGGHAMAAGLSLRQERYDDFRLAFEREVAATLSADELQEVLETDGAVPPDEMRIETAEIIKAAGPWGQHFPEPVFDDEFEILSWKIVGEKHLKMQLRPPHGEPVDAIAFNTLVEDLPSTPTVRAAYRMDVNAFRNRRSLQLIVSYITEATR
jgi:single-stranded-DNA-specific exonuclease